ncbi:hypothetical protein [Qipengyuania sp. ASV99]|uniref:hypothetical protein n=1 Tax=Qipengyuania sp. ASV99 TaxID=3399681 RepID=UPI003A4C65B8
MSDLERRFIEDRAIRDAARAVLMADITHARASLSAKGVAARIGGRIGDGAKDVFEVAKAHSEDNRGIIAALIGAVLLWLGREPILEILGLSDSDETSEDAPKFGEKHEQ